MTLPMDLGALEQEYAEMATSEEARYVVYGDDRILGLITELRAARKVVEAAQGLVRIRFFRESSFGQLDSLHIALTEYEKVA